MGEKRLRYERTRDEPGRGEVRAIRVHVDSHGQETPGLEALSELFGQPGHLGGVSGWLVPLVQPLVSPAKPVDLGLSGS